MSKEVKIPGPAKGYTDLIDEALLAEEAKPKSKKYFPLRPSAAGYCSRRLAFDLMEYRGFAEYEKKSKDPATIRLLNLGSSVEWHSIRNFELISKQIPDLNVRYKQNTVTLFRLDATELGAGELIEGSLDLAMVATSAGGIGDVKSKKEKFHQAFKTDWDASLEEFAGMESLVQISETSFYAPDLKKFLHELNDPFFADNFYQVNTYLCTEWARERGFDHGFIYRYSKNSSRHLEIRFSPTMEMFKEVEEKFNRVNQAVAKKDPESIRCDYMLGSARCAFCPYSDKCWDDDAMKAYFDTFPKKAWPKDLDRLEDGDQLEKLFKKYEKALEAAEATEQLEDEILKRLIEAKVNKVRLSNSNIYEVKRLKYEIKLKRSKV